MTLHPFLAFSALALICTAHAATISTPSLGEIYSMPAWMPSSVDAAHTPGSVAASNYPARVTADRRLAKSTTQATPVKSCKSTRDGR